jgi:Putative ATPase subunit of terminase (gpP-like)
VFVRRKEEERRRARELRAMGWSVRAITAELGVAKSSVSLWVRDVPVPPTPEPRRRRRLPVLSGRVQRCGRCRKSLPVEFFNRHPKRGRQHWCRECFKSYFRERGQRHRDHVKVNRRDRVALAREYLLERLDREHCTDCGETHLVVLDFDHVRGEKASEICLLVSEGASIRKLEEEMAKCEVVCGNCHRRRTADRARSWRARAHTGEDFAADLPGVLVPKLELAHAALTDRGCVDCGVRDPRVLEFDHVGSKRFSVMSGVWLGYAAERLKDEIARCAVRCTNCHRLRTAERRGSFRFQALLETG